MSSSIEVKTLSEILEKLKKDGYILGFRASGSALVSYTDNKAYNIHDFIIDYTYRLEGPTDPGEEVIVFALTCRNNNRIKGTYTVAFGPLMSAEDSNIVTNLKK